MYSHAGDPSNDITTIFEVKRECLELLREDTPILRCSGTNFTVDIDRIYQPEVTNLTRRRASLSSKKRNLLSPEFGTKASDVLSFFVVAVFQYFFTHISLRIIIRNFIISVSIIVIILLSFIVSQDTRCRQYDTAE